MLYSPTERQEHAVMVLAYAMSGEKSDGLNAAMHAMLTHEKHAHGLVKGPGPMSHVEQFQRFQQVALNYGESLKLSWDGDDFGWLHYADMLIRTVESIYTYFIPEGWDRVTT